MRRALAALTLLLAFLLCFAGTASGAYVDATSKNRVGVSGPNPNICTYVLGSLELEPQGEITVLGYDPATGVVFYVRQNPWSKFDPLGLFEGTSIVWGMTKETTPTVESGVLTVSVAASTVPGVGEAQDAAVLADPNSSRLEKAVASASLGLNAVTGGASPNAGGVIKSVRKMLGKADDAPTPPSGGGSPPSGGGGGDPSGGAGPSGSNPTGTQTGTSGPDFIVTESGTAIPTNQTQMRQGFDEAGFPSRPATHTSESGTIHTVPTPDGPVDVRTMEGSKHHPKRAVFTEANTNSPVKPDGSKFRNNEPKQQRRAESHVEQHD